MLLIALLILTLVFALFFVGRVGAARRAAWIAQWPAVLLACAAFLALTRGAVWPGAALGALALAAWRWLPLWRQRQTAAPAAGTEETAADAEARRILGVQRGASAEEIRAAYRSRMAQAHPDRGGAHNEAARLTAARDRLLRRR